MRRITIILCLLAAAQIVREALGADGDCEGIDLSEMFTKEAGRIMLMI